MNDFDDILLVAEEMSSKKHYFYFDEIQNIDDWEKFAIRVANQGYKVDITGSNEKMLSNEVAAKLGGRYIMKEILPYSFKEYLRANNLNNDAYSTKEIAKINNILEQYFIYGGFPASIDFKNKREYVSSVYQKVLYNDIITHNKVRSENGMKLLIKKISESVMQDISYTRLQNIITGIGYKISKDVIIDYCGYIKDSFLLFTIENYFASFVDKSSNPKYYFRDNGVLNLFVDGKKTALLENIVAINLYRYNYEMYYLKGNKIDVDFYLPNNKTLIQVSYSLSDSDTYDRELSNLINYANEIKEELKLVIVTYDEKRIIEINDKKIYVVPLKDFLLNNY